MPYNNEIELSKVLKEGVKQGAATLHVHIPAIVVDYDFSQQKASVRPAVKIKMQDGKTVEPPVIHNVPVMFPASGGAFLHFPVKTGDKVMLYFSDRNTENFKLNGVISDPASPALHSMTDAYCTPSLMVFNAENLVQNNDDVHLIYAGSAILLKPNGEVVIKSTKTTIDCPQTFITGQLNVAREVNFGTDIGSGETATVKGNINLIGSMSSSGDIVAGGVSLINHTHSGVDTGGGNTGTPN